MQLAKMHEALEAHPDPAAGQKQVQLLEFKSPAFVRMLSVDVCQSWVHNIPSVARMCMETLVLTTGAVDSEARGSCVQCCRN